jgi:adenosylhomocysteine nucleosidase
MTEEPTGAVDDHGADRELTVAGVVAALAAEARALGRLRRSPDGVGILDDGSRVLVGGIGGEAARAAARRLLDSGACALVSWGLAGGLDPALEAGAVLVPFEVVDGRGTRFAAASTWRESLIAAIGGPVVSGTLLTSPVPLASIEDKRAAFERGAVAVDMESAAIAEVASSNRVPFIAVRVVVDTARDAVPAAVASAGRSGRLEIGRLLSGLLRSPGEIGALFELARRYRCAVRSLEAVARANALTPPPGALTPPEASPTRLAQAPGSTAPSRSPGPPGALLRSLEEAPGSTAPPRGRP